ncbi:MAG TPA: ATP-dependent DNA helicase UvrD2 [Acidimicrobiales bacterium]|nr:ATP-dependent DNA helicase UvrD2 [Acidimicrobiales bacterium]
MSFPGPDALGRGLVVAPGGEVPPGWEGVERARVDDAALADPGPALSVLHPAWAGRRRVVVELAVDAAELRRPESERRPAHQLDPSFEFRRERLHFLVWANNYDGRTPAQPPVWWHGVRAVRDRGAAEGGPADVVLPDGRPAWCDGGPRQPVAVPEPVVHRDSIDAGFLTPATDRPPTAPLAPDQLAAVTHPGGPARILAPAGSGKTRVLTERLRHLVADRNHEAELLTAVAYNVKAADELRERTADLAGLRGPNAVVGPTIRTLNSFGLAICTMVSAPRVIEEREARSLLETVVKVRRRTNADPLAPYLDALSLTRLGLVDPEEAEARIPDAAGVAAAFPTWRALLAERNLVDFDEQIYRALSSCLADPHLRARARATARTLLVDEFQDLTPAHVLLLRLVAGPAASVFGVGDDDQVIYGYAGADPGFLIDFPRYFPAAATYQLSVNYRCPPAVVSAVGRLLGYNRRRVAKSIAARPGRDEVDGELAVERVSDLAPAARERVVAWLAEGVPLAHVAVLARVNSVLLPVQVLLTEAGVGCTRAVGPEVLSRTGSSAALAYLRMGLAPDDIAAADVSATVRRPSRKIARNVLEMMTRRPTTSVGALRRLAQWLSGDDAERVAGYVDDIHRVAEAVVRSDTASVLDLVRTGIGLDTALEALDSSRGTADRSAHGDDLWALEQVAALHPDPATFEPWLRQVLSVPTAGDDDVVHLSTVHKVKGREWPRVIVFGASAGLFPHRLAEDVEEERRVFHVAVTRASDAAVVLADGARPSPFLDELAGVAPEPAVATAPRQVPLDRARRAAAPPAVLTGEALPAFEALRAWRTEQARREKMPPYVVMSDAHLRGIAERGPKSLVELSRCSGIGPVKLERYGDDILRVLEQATRA